MKIIVAGATEAGIELARILSVEGNEVVLMDKNANRLQEAEEHLDVRTLLADSTRRSSLVKAEVADSHGFVAVSDDDNDNVLSAALAKTMGARITVARMDSPDFYLDNGSHELNLIGVDLLLCATRLTTVRLIDAIMSTHLPFLDTFANASIRVALVTMGDHSEEIGKPASEITFKKRVHTVAVVSNGYLRYGDRVSSVEAGDQLLVVGVAEDMLHLWRHSLPKHTNDRAFIIGGGDVGENLALILGEHVKRVEVVEKDAERARKIAAMLPRATVFSGDARSTTFLEDQQIDTVNYLLAATGDDEINLLVSLLGRKLGVPHPIVVLHRPGYAELYRELGIDGTVGLYEMIANHARYAVAPCGLIRYQKLPQTGFVVSEWRLPPHPVALEKKEMNIAGIPLPPDVRLIGAAQGTRALRIEESLRLEGGETLLLLSTEDSLTTTRKSLKKLLQERPL